MKNKTLYIALCLVFFASCSSSENNSEQESEKDQVEKLIDRDQAKSDSLKKSLGIE